MVSEVFLDNLDKEDIVEVAFYIYLENEHKNDFKKSCKVMWKEEFPSFNWIDLWLEIEEYLY